MRWILPVLLATAVLAGGEESALDAYRAQIQAFREQREKRLTGTDGWLAVAGLFFLRPGANAVGSEPGSNVLLPGSAPKRLGVLTLQDGRVTARIEEPAGVTINGQPLAQAELAPATETRPADKIQVGSLTLHLHKSGERLAIRLRDTENPLRREFAGLSWFEVDPEYKVSARLIPDPKPSTIEVVNTLGDLESYPSEGMLEFVLRGQQLRLRPLWDDGALFVIFRDQTSGKQTYPAARFLYADLPKDGVTVLDFNKAYNPPCAFNPYTTCPLPPKENRLAVRVEAGEKAYRGKHAAAPAAR
jgi:uncharacterized protein (DUF1684 family)